MARVPRALLAGVFTAYAVSASAQGGLPTSQPNYLTIVREEVKLGRSADHERIEAGWPAAYDKAKSPDYYLAYVSTTGRPEAWFVAPSESHKSMGDSMARENDDAVLSAEVKRLQKVDADVLNNVSVIQARGRKELSMGAFPELAKTRFVEITIFRVRPGHEREFEAAAKAYGSAAKRAAPETSFRVYEVIAGIPGPTYFVFSSTQSFAQFDKATEDGMATMKGASDEERSTLEKFSREGLINVETQRFRVDPAMSYVPKEIRASDPAFWMPKKPVAAKPATSSQ
jgi:heme-degrading monooxygenase HmoA